MKSINHALTAVLVLHPIGTRLLPPSSHFTPRPLAHAFPACGFSFLTLLASLFIVRARGGAGYSRGASFLTLGVGLFTALLTTVVFLIDVIFVAVAKHQIKDATDGLVTGTWGNAVRPFSPGSRPADLLSTPQVWMVLGAAVALWGALVGACVGLVRGRRTTRCVCDAVMSCRQGSRQPAGPPATERRPHGTLLRYGIGQTVVPGPGVRGAAPVPR